MKRYANDDDASRQIDLIRRLVAEGWPDQKIALHLSVKREQNPRTGSSRWSSGDVARIRGEFQFSRRTFATQPLAATGVAAAKVAGVGMRILCVLAGFAFLGLSVYIAYLTWSSLPGGRYPVIIAGIPALPTIVLGLVCFGAAASE
jgi:hypothetical protein